MPRREPGEPYYRLSADEAAEMYGNEDVVFIDELPRNPMGKVLKRVLREDFNQPITT